MSDMATSDPRAAIETRIPATALRLGDLVNTSPGGDDDWQQVLGVWGRADDVPGDRADLSQLVRSLGGRYVVVELTDIAPVDANVYFNGGRAMLYATDESGENAVTSAISDEDGVRTYLYTKFELVTIRAV